MTTIRDFVTTTAIATLHGVLPDKDGTRAVCMWEGKLPAHREQVVWHRSRMARCPSCSNEAPDRGRYCPACGAALESPTGLPTRTSAQVP